MFRLNRSVTVAWLLMVAMVLGVAAQVQAAYDKRLELAEKYMHYLHENQFKEAHSMLATDESFDDFMMRLNKAKKHFAQEIGEKGFELVSRKVLAVNPMTFEENYIIVAVRTEIIVKQGSQEMNDVMHFDVYFRFNKEGQIEMVHGIADGYC